jgi:hypothetical protein
MGVVESKLDAFTQQFQKMHAYVRSVEAMARQGFSVIWDGCSCAAGLKTDQVYATHATVAHQIGHDLAALTANGGA